MRRLIAVSLTMLLTSGCAVGPNYKRPSVNVPGTYRGAPPQEAQQPAAESLGDQKWWEVFQDNQLQDLIHTALQQNYDVRIAATRILEARAQVGITRADQFPTISAGAQSVDQRSARTKFFPAFETSAHQVDLSLAWDLDFWGKYRRANESARASLLATQWAREAVISTLVSDVAAAYFQLRELDLQLEISRSTLASRQDSLQLTQTLANGGATSMLDVRQAEQLVSTAAETIPDLERRIEQQENFISTLLGNNPGPIARGAKLTQQPHAREVPAGLASSLLERRPDIRQAEAQLIAANAQIGVAKAAYFPQISLTGSGGFQSSALTSLFTGPAGLWSFGGSLVQPIFTGGKIRSTVKLTHARQQETLLVYQQTIQQAFRGVSDALVEYRKDREFREQQENSRLPLVAVRWDGRGDYLGETRVAPDVIRLGAIRSAMLVMRLMTAFIGLHILEILLWAGFYRWLCFPLWESAFYFSAASYATVGYGDVVLPQVWRTLGTVESIIGVLMCGLSASFLFAIVTRLVEREARVSDTPVPDTGDTGPETRIRQPISRLSNAN